MIELPRLWTRSELLAADLGSVCVWATPSLAALTASLAPFPQGEPCEALPSDLDTLIAVGGGALMDRAKLAARECGRPVRLIAVPSLWGSGAEASPIVVLDREGAKEIHVDAKYVPDGRSIWPELMASIPDDRARYGCGDCWAHALEGFLSPLASDELRQDLADLMRRMLNTRLGKDIGWFELSAAACAGQARSSVGLVHGMAHALEGPLRAAQPDEGWHHARLCSVFLYPVMRYNQGGSCKWAEVFGRYALNEGAVLAVARDLFDQEAYRKAVPVMIEHWRSVLINPCTRTNSVTVRPATLEYFREEKFT
jgi:alcohol dehydrogenase class IV